MGWTPRAFTARQSQWVLRERRGHQCSHIDTSFFSNNTLHRLPVLGGCGCAGAGSHGGCAALGSPMWRLLWRCSLLRKDEPRRATHYYHMHTSTRCLCPGAWGYRGMYVIIALSRLCQEESLKGLKDQRHSTPFNSACNKKFGAMAPAPLSFKTQGGGGGAQGHKGGGAIIISTATVSE